jgi:hypothetical protein
MYIYIAVKWESGIGNRDGALGIWEECGIVGWGNGVEREGVHHYWLFIPVRKGFQMSPGNRSP